MINYNGEFWNYCGIIIPTNIHYEDVSETEMFCDAQPYTIKEYQTKYFVCYNTSLFDPY